VSEDIEHNITSEFDQRWLFIVVAAQVCVRDVVEKIYREVVLVR